MGGWKIGAGGPDETPLYAPIPAADIHPAEVTLSAADFPGAIIEAEIAFRLLRDLPPRAEAYDLATVAAAVELLPALEIYRSRYRDAGAVDAAENIADGLANAGLVVGAPASGSPSAETGWDIDLVVDGKTVSGRALRHPVGDPRGLVAWLADHLAATGGMLRAGQVVTTGALTLASLGREVRCSWRDLGAVSVHFT